MAKEAYYFSHDSNARHDEKMLQLRAVYKGEGYGWYWIIIEMMRDANAFRLQYDGRYAFAAIAKELDCTEDQARNFVDDCINEFKLFTINDGFFYSESLLRRMSEVDARREKARESAKIRWERNANAMRTHCEGNAIKEKKGKEKKGNNPPISPEGDEPVAFDIPPARKRSVFRPPTQEEVTQYFTERQGGKWTPEDIARQAMKWFERYTSNGWMVGRTKMKDWKAAVRTWITNDYDGCTGRYTAAVASNGEETMAQFREREKMVY